MPHLDRFAQVSVRRRRTVRRIPGFVAISSSETVVSSSSFEFQYTLFTFPTSFIERRRRRRCTAHWDEPLAIADSSSETTVSSSLLKLRSDVALVVVRLDERPHRDPVCVASLLADCHDVVVPRPTGMRATNSCNELGRHSSGTCPITYCGIDRMGGFAARYGTGRGVPIIFSRPVPIPKTVPPRRSGWMPRRLIRGCFRRRPLFIRHVPHHIHVLQPPAFGCTGCCEFAAHGLCTGRDSRGGTSCGPRRRSTSL